MAKVSEIKERYSIVNVVERYVDLEHKYDDEYKGVCPFHDDHSPSMSVNVGKGVYHCLACGASGDVIDFVMDIEGVKFIDAIEIITGGDFNEQIIFDKKENKQNDLLCLVDSKKKLGLMSRCLRSIVNIRTNTC